MLSNVCGRRDPCRIMSVTVWIWARRLVGGSVIHLVAMGSFI